MGLHSIRSKMMIFVAVLLAVSFSVSGFFYYTQSRQLIEQDVLESAQSGLNHTAITIQSYLDAYARGVELWAGTDAAAKIVSQPDAWNVLRNNFNKYRTVNPSTSVLYIGTETGKIFLEPDAKLPDGYDPRKRDWYQKAIQSPDKAIWSDPYISADNGQVVITTAKAVLDPATKKPVAVVGADITLNKLTEDLSKTETGYGGFLFVLDGNGVALVYPEMMGKNVKDQYPYIKQIYDSAETSGTVEYAEGGSERMLKYIKIPGLNWIVGQTFDKHALFAKLDTMRNTVITIFSVSMLVALLACYVGAGRISRPITRLAESMGRFAKGDLTVKVESKGRDEVAMLSGYFNQMTEEMRDLIQQVVHAASDVSAFSTQLHSSAVQTTRVSEEVARTIQQVAAGSVSQAENAESGNDKMMRLADAIEHMNEASQKMKALSQTMESVNQQGMEQVHQLKEKTQQSRGVMGSIEETIRALDERAKEIDVIIDVITQISNQTSLLALNAAIEAARAGEHGKGFAVVAGEVQKLAAQSTAAAEDIRQRVETIQAEAHRAATEMAASGREVADVQFAAVCDTEHAFTEIATTMKQIVEQVNVFAGEMATISQAKDDVVQAIQEMNAVSQETAAASEEVNASTDEQILALRNVLEAADHLATLSAKLQETTTRFRL